MVKPAGLPNEMVVSVCSWCAGLHILKMPELPRGHRVKYFIVLDGAELRIQWIGGNLGECGYCMISDGICEGCRASKFPETITSAAVDPAFLPAPAVG